MMPLWRSRKRKGSIREMEFKPWLLSELFKAYLDARKGKRGTDDEHIFELNWFRNLRILRDNLISRRYKPSRGIQFDVQNPVPREIVAAPFRDRVVQHFLYNMSGEWWERRFIRDSYSCQKGKGTLDGISRLRDHIRSVSQGYTIETYVIKCDIQSFFMSIERKKLFEIIAKGLDKQFSDKPAMRDFLKFIWRKVIMDDPMDGVRHRGRQSKKARLKVPFNKRMCNQPSGFGLVIGNLTSQLAANIFMNRFDWYVKTTLDYKHYGRYVDDFFIVVTKEQLSQALKDIEKIRKYLADNLGLTLHPHKFYCQNVDKGVEFLGAVIYPNKMVTSRRFKRNFLNAAAAFGVGKKTAESFISYFGHGKCMSTKGINAKAIRRLEWEIYKHYAGTVLWHSASQFGDSHD